MTCDAGAPWPFWCPEPGVDDTWKPLGYPAVEGYFERVDAPVTSPGVGIPWASLPGNHDVMRQGTSLTNAPDRAHRRRVGQVVAAAAGLPPR